MVSFSYNIDLIEECKQFAKLLHKPLPGGGLKVSVQFRCMRRACNTKWRLNGFCAIENTMNLGVLWSDEEVITLIHIWGDDKIQQELDGALRNKLIFVAIARK